MRLGRERWEMHRAHATTHPDKCMADFFPPSLRNAKTVPPLKSTPRMLVCHLKFHRAVVLGGSGAGVKALTKLPECEGLSKALRAAQYCQPSRLRASVKKPGAKEAKVELQTWPRS